MWLDITLGLLRLPGIAALGCYWRWGAIGVGVLLALGCYFRDRHNPGLL